MEGMGWDGGLVEKGEGGGGIDRGMCICIHDFRISPRDKAPESSHSIITQYEHRSVLYPVL
jgi:hypothetical protein